jgi:hypothetical protein
VDRQLTAIGNEYKTSGDYLEAADREFAAGNHDAGSSLLTQSVHCALGQLAEEARKRAETRADLREFAEWLDQKRGTDGWHARNLRTANSFHDNAVHSFLHPDDMDLGQPLVREFVEQLRQDGDDVAMAEIFWGTVNRITNAIAIQHGLGSGSQLPRLGVVVHHLIRNHQVELDLQHGTHAVGVFHGHFYNSHLDPADLDGHVADARQLIDDLFDLYDQHRQP